MAEELGEKRRAALIVLIQRAVGRPYLFMAAVVLTIGAIWFLRLAVEEFLLIDRLVNVYTSDAQVQMDSFAIRPAVTAEVREVAVKQGQVVRQGQILLRLAQEDIQAGLAKAEAVRVTTEVFSKSFLIMVMVSLCEISLATLVPVRIWVTI